MTTPQDSLAGQVAVVTGAGRGIGKVVALTFAKAGATVVACARTPAEIEETAAEIRAAGGTATVSALDVTDEPSVNEAFAAIHAEHGVIDILVNNAGTNLALGQIWEVDPADWRRDIETSLYGPFFCSRAVLPAMVERGAGRIINLSSGAATEPRPYTLAYTSAKTGAHRFSESLAIAVEPFGVKVFSLNPGPVKTSLTAGLRGTELGKKYFDDSKLDYFPPERAAGYALILASGRADHLAGRFVSSFDDLEAVVAESRDVLPGQYRRLAIQTALAGAAEK
jgi:NAD(P)-dependent dehydrogenase (short-subunit alcohol dehydrogenase family)